MIETGKKQEKVILVAAATEEIEKAERSLDELGELVKTAGRGVWTYDSGKRHDSYGNLYRKRKVG